VGYWIPYSFDEGRESSLSLTNQPIAEARKKGIGAGIQHNIDSWYHILTYWFGRAYTLYPLEEPTARC